MNEMVRNFSHDAYDLTDPRGHDMCVRLLDHVRDKMVEFQEATGHLYNLEATPAEGTTYRLVLLHLLKIISERLWMDDFSLINAF